MRLWSDDGRLKALLREGETVDRAVCGRLVGCVLSRPGYVAPLVNCLLWIALRAGVAGYEDSRGTVRLWDWWAALGYLLGCTHVHRHVHRTQRGALEPWGCQFYWSLLVTFLRLDDSACCGMMYFVFVAGCSTSHLIR